MKQLLGLSLILFIPNAVFADTFAVVLNGVPGSEEHAARFTDWTKMTRTLLMESFDFGEDDVIVLSNREARAEHIRNLFLGLVNRVGDSDVLFVFFIGHGSFDGDEYKFNIPGPDLTASDYDSLISSVNPGQSVIVNGTNSSGGGIEKLAAPNRVIITATRSGTERNDTIFYDEFLKALTDDASDIDKNDRLSVWEAFRHASLLVERFYKEKNQIPTEHPRISDNGQEKVGADPSEVPLLASQIHFNSVLDLEIEDPVLQKLLKERQELEKKIKNLRLVKDSMPLSDYDKQIESLLIELALKSQEIRLQVTGP